VKDLRELGTLLLGFMPWLLFLFLSRSSLQSLEVAILLSLAASLTFGFQELRRGFLLQWGSLIFFLFCAVAVNGLHSIWVATHMDLLANVSLASIIWLTLLTGHPFALQYARNDLPPERWNDPALVSACRLVTAVWALLMTASAGVSLYKRTGLPQAGERTYFLMSLGIVTAGLVFTTAFKRHKRMQRERANASSASAGSAPASGSVLP